MHPIPIQSNPIHASIHLVHFIPPSYLSIQSIYPFSPFHPIHLPVHPICLSSQFTLFLHPINSPIYLLISSSNLFIHPSYPISPSIQSVHPLGSSLHPLSPSYLFTDLSIHRSFHLVNQSVYSSCPSIRSVHTIHSSIHSVHFLIPSVQPYNLCRDLSIQLVHFTCPFRSFIHPSNPFTQLSSQFHSVSPSICPSSPSI